jgi:FecR protein
VNRTSSTITTLFAAALCLPLAQAQQPVSAAADNTPQSVSNIRIVRLSQVKGEVTIDRNVGGSSEKAFANIAITGGARLATQDGLSEVEFEDNTTLRLAPDSQVEFTQLGRAASGATISHIHVARGTIYVSLAKTKGNVFTLSAGTSTVVPAPGSHIRLTLAGPNSNLTVLDGEAQFTSPSTSMALARRKSLDFDSSDAQPPVLAKAETAPFDQWDKDQDKYQTHYSSLTGSGGTGYLYGSSDLNYYGSFSDVGGCGSMWRPYFATAAWEPYSNGMWAYYPSAGYSWVSPYPWGWLPFHSGSWAFCAGSGWGWQPGGQWQGLANVPTPTTGSPITLRPPQIPQTGKSLLVPVNTKPLVISKPTSEDTFTFRKDSAGLGIPRDTFGKLNHVSAEVEHHGFANAGIETGYIGPNGRTVGGQGNREPGSNTLGANNNHNPNAPSNASHDAWNHGGNPSSSGTSNASHGGWNGGGGGNYSGGHSSAPPPPPPPAPTASSPAPAAASPHK